MEEVIIMAQTLINFRIDKETKEEMEDVCSELGITMSTALNIFAKKMAREKRIPFDVSIDPFYSESNMKHIEKVVSDIETGDAKLEEHELIEEE